jgi:ribosomal protein L5
VEKEPKKFIIQFRVNEAERAMIEKAAAKMHRTTGAKPTISRAILQIVKQHISG